MTVTDSSTSIKSDLAGWISEENIDLIIIGSNSFQQASDPDSWISRTWASVINSVTRPVPQYLYEKVPCEITLVNADGSTISRPSIYPTSGVLAPLVS